MSVLLRVMCVVVVTGFQDVQKSPHPPSDIWNQIRSFAEENPSRKNPELVEYLKSLTQEQMLGAARYAWEECSRDLQFDSDEDRMDACGSGMMLCLEYYLDECAPEKCVSELLKIARDTTECYALRYAIIGSMWNAGARSRFAKNFPSYVMGRLGQAEVALVSIVEHRGEHGLLRKQAMQELGSLLRERARLICESDPGVREVLRKTREHSNNRVSVSELIRSGEATLTDETTKALQTIVERMRSNVKLLARILGDENEPGDLRKQARRTLEGYQANVTALLTRILKDKSEPWLVRDGTMDYLAHQITTEVGKIIRSDPNARAVWERTHTFAFVGKMLRSGELTFTQDTVKVLEPFEARALAHVKLLAAILADENEPEELRKGARRRLEVWRRSALTGLDKEVEKALQQAASIKKQQNEGL